jgi:enoyl-CoA hydratase/carnithine racemase
MQPKYSSIKITVEDGTAVLTIDNPPVNQMSLQLSRDLTQAITECFADAEIKALILTGTGKNFVAGADITELQAVKHKAEAFRMVWIAAELFNGIEAGPKPVMAAINGNCPGGGLEMALACHYRVGTKGSCLGLPEVQIGVIPGAGGIQRLPRLIGLPDALGMITNGQSISGELDRESRMTNKRKDRLPGIEDKKALIEDFKTRNAKKLKGTIAPLKALEAIEKGLTDNLAADIRRDAELFSECAVSDVAKNLIGVFLNEHRGRPH